MANRDGLKSRNTKLLSLWLANDFSFGGQCRLMNKKRFFPPNKRKHLRVICHCLNVRLTSHEVKYLTTAHTSLSEACYCFNKTLVKILPLPMLLIMLFNSLSTIPWTATCVNLSWVCFHIL